MRGTWLGLLIVRTFPLLTNNLPGPTNHRMMLSGDGGIRPYRNGTTNRRVILLLPMLAMATGKLLLNLSIVRMESWS